MISHVKQQRYLLCVRDSRRRNLHARSRMPWLTLPAGELVEWDVCKGVGPLITQSLHSQAFFKFGLRNDESHTGQPAPQEWGGCVVAARNNPGAGTLTIFPRPLWTGRSMCACRAAVYAHCCVQATADSAITRSVPARAYSGYLHFQQCAANVESFHQRVHSGCLLPVSIQTHSLSQQET